MGTFVHLIFVLHFIVYCTQVEMSADQPKRARGITKYKAMDARLTTISEHKIEVKNAKSSSENDAKHEPEKDISVGSSESGSNSGSGSEENKKKRKKKKDNDDDVNTEGPEWKYFGAEQAAGAKSDLSHSNPKYKLTQHYDLQDLGRRSDQSEGENLDLLAEDRLLRSISDLEENTKEPTPVKASPEFVLGVVNATKERTNDSFSHLLPKQALRTMDFFDGVWQEDINPAALRTGPAETPITLEAVKVKIYEGTRLHEIVQELKKISPQLLYIINKQ